MTRASAATPSRRRAVVLAAAAAAVAIAVVVALLLWPNAEADADASVPVQRVEVPLHVGEQTLVHGNALDALAGVTCTAADGLVQAVGSDMVDGWAGGVVAQDPPPTLFAIDDFTYESFQSLYWADDVTALDTGGADAGGTDCATYLDGTTWVLLLHYGDAAQAASSLTAPLDSYDALVEPATATGWDYLGCRATASGSECVAPLGDTVAWVGSGDNPHTLAAWSGELLSATAAASAGAR